MALSIEICSKYYVGFSTMLTGTFHHYLPISLSFIYLSSIITITYILTQPMLNTQILCVILALMLMFLRTENENHKTQTEFEDSLILKTLLFKMVSGENKSPIQLSILPPPLLPFSSVKVNHTTSHHTTPNHITSQRIISQHITLCHNI